LTPNKKVKKGSHGTTTVWLKRWWGQMTPGRYKARRHLQIKWRKKKTKKTIEARSGDNRHTRGKNHGKETEKEKKKD